MAVSVLMVIKITTSQTARTNESYAKAGSVVSSTVRSIRTILSLNAVEDMIARFKAATSEACEISRKSAVSLGAANGFNMVSMVLAYLIATMFGVSWLVAHRRSCCRYKMDLPVTRLVLLNSSAHSLVPVGPMKSDDD
jgi:ABC-type bacteriocin/lantibiotic exporter with double-glycine peptidase domain